MAAALEATGLPPNARAQDLTLHQFAGLAWKLEGGGQEGEEGQGEEEQEGEEGPGEGELEGQGEGQGEQQGAHE